MPAPSSIRAQLRLFAVLVLVGTATAAVLLGITVLDGVTTAVTARLEAVADVTVNAIEASTAETRDILTGLSRMPGVRSLDPERCGPVLVEAMSFLPGHLGATVTDTLGNVVCVGPRIDRTGLPGNARDRAWFQAVRRRDSFTVGPPVEGRLSGTPIVVFALPVRDDAGLTRGYVTLSSPTVERFRTLVSRLGDERTLVTLATESGLVVARSRDPSSWLGRRLPDAEVALVAGDAGSEVRTAPDGDGVTRIWVRRDIDEYGWHVLAGLPRAEVRELALRRMATPLGAFLLLLAGLAWIVFRVRKSLDRGLTALIRTMRGPGRSEEAQPVAPEAPAEVQAVARQFARTHAELDAAVEREQELRTLLQSILNNAVFGIFVCDSMGRLEGCNPAMAEMLGYEDETQLGALTVADLFQTPHEAEVLLSTAPGTRGSGEAEWRAADGRTIPVRLHWAVTDEVDRPPMVQCIAEDLSERRELEVQFRQAQKLEAVGRLAGGVAHDFNNRLTVITGQAELLLTELDADDPRREYAEGILASADRAADLTAQLLAFSRRQPLSPTRLEVDRVARDLIPMLGRLLGESVALETEWAEVPHVMADAGQIEQILLNLATNARDAVNGRGRILISTFAGELDDEEAARRQPEALPGPHAVLAVQDDGTGIAPEVMEHIFEPFFTTKPTGQGTGLGLSTVYGITTQYGGHLRVDSAPGGGTRIEVWLPAWRDDAASPPSDRPREADLPLPSGFEPLPRVDRPASPAAQTAGEGDVEGATVLLVEDEPQLRRLLERTLTRAGFRVVVAPDGPAALRAVDSRETRVDLLLTDMRMPELRGDELAAALRSRFEQLRVLYMSGDAGSIPDEPGQGAAALAKPFTPAQLLARVRAVLDTAGTDPARRRA